MQAAQAIAQIRIRLYSIVVLLVRLTHVNSEVIIIQARVVVIQSFNCYARKHIMLTQMGEGMYLLCCFEFQRYVWNFDKCILLDFSNVVRNTFNGNSIFFLSDRDGFRNLYRYNLVTGKIYQQTKYLTGISGITMQSPAISISNEARSWNKPM